ncbi:nucleotide sugar dehydrogenase [Azospirillum rugosum]|uniref:UDP-glucose 6-dehydrogenase n=1 Tax=Azospirillum rugosum TaxID=416170 RepID=A0ABS4SP03_9PROT|nr:nucleotide sugar dehydrogenase [Azospirillum rugosum]MBP2294288.1 UDPglucose 6-dehydrogenase [Azospirillum rugosum]MDQ0527623.1 UDPglucose 6-dehydrogenase [Azospirillum rugosum]
MKPTIAYLGMTHLGLVSGIAAASKGFDVVCFDPDPERIATLERGDLPVVEPGLPELLAENRERLRFTADAGALAGCGVVYIAPDVPTDDSGASDLGPIRALLDRVEPALAADASLVILSQVPPGFTRSRQRSGRSLYYQVETLIFGRAVERATQPERFIVGCADAAQPLAPAYRSFLEAFGCPILPMRFESAELAKISINVCLVASVSVANTLAELCERVGAVWQEIVPALRLDRRIGPYSYLAPGLGIAGGNLERDLATVIGLAEREGTDAGVIRAFLDNSRHRRDWALRVLHAEVLSRRRNPVIAVLGLAYKEDTASIKNSPSLALIAHLHGTDLRLYDPVVPASAANAPRAVGAADPLDACDGADALVIMTPWRQFRDLDPTLIAGRLAGRTVVDPYGVLDPAACRDAGLIHIRLGAPLSMLGAEADA